MNKLSRVLVQALLFGMLLSIPSTVSAEAVSITTVSFSNIQVTAAFGVIQFGVWQARANAMANNNLGQNAAPNPAIVNGGVAQAVAIVDFANGTGIADAINLSTGAASQVDVFGCNCVATGAGQAGLTNTFVIVGGNGNVNVSISGLFVVTQLVQTNQFGLVAGSDVSLEIFVDNLPVFTFDGTVNVGGPNEFSLSDLSLQLAPVVMLQFNVPHTINISVRAISSGANQVPPGAVDVPEPTTAVLLVSGLAFMTGLVRKRRMFRR